MNIRWNEKTLHHKGPTLGAYNWTEIERYDTTDLQLLLRELEPHTKYEILLQAYNQFGRGPVAKIEAETGEKGEPHSSDREHQSLTMKNIDRPIFYFSKQK